MPQLMSREAVCVGLKAMLLQFGVAADARSTDDPDTRRAFTLSAAYTADLLRNASGGLEVGNTYLDNLDITLAIDGEQAFGVPGFELFVYGLYNNANRFSERYAGDAMTASNIDSPRAIRLYEAWAQWTFADARASLRAGLYDLNSEFDVSDARGTLINSSFGVGHELAQTGVNGPSIFPSTSLAVRFAYELGSDWAILAAAFDGVPGDPDVPARTRVDISEEDGALLITELQRSREDARLRKLAIGAWSYTETFERIDDTLLGVDPPRKGTSTGGYALADFSVWQDRERSARRVEAFARIGIASADVNEYDRNAQAGIIVRQPFGAAAEESLGFAVSWARTGSPARRAWRELDSPIEEAESVIELTYRRALLPWLTVQPDLQYIVNPSADPSLDDALVIFLRVELAAERNW
jgi:porin